MRSFTGAQRVPIVVAAAAVALISPLARAEKPSYEELEAKVAALSADVQQLKSEVRTPPSAAAVDDTVRRVLEDANRRSQFLSDSGPVNAGYDNGFFIKSDDGNFSLRPSVYFQGRYAAAYREEGKRSGGNDTQNGFEIRRLRPALTGNVLSPDLTYFFQWETQNGNATSTRTTSNGGTVTDQTVAGGSLFLLDAIFTYRLNPDWYLKGGQFTDPINHETLIGPARQLAAELSLVDQYLSVARINRVQGLGVIYGNYGKAPLNAELVVHDGGNTQNTTFVNEDAAGLVTDFGVSGRTEYKIFGDWKNYRDFTAKGTKEDLLVVGAGGDITQGDNRTSYIGNVDAQYESSNGIGLYAAYLADYYDLRNVIGEDSRLDQGFVAQAGYLFTSSWEVFGRYDILFLDKDFVAAGATDQVQEITVGLNWYLGKGGSAGHRAKVTFDVGYLPDGAPAGLTGLNILPSQEAELVGRAQFQLQI